MFGKIKGALFRVFKRGHPDIYNALKSYCEKHGYDMSDVVAGAVASFMAADEEGKQELLEKMAQRRTPAGSPLNVKTTLELFKDFCDAMKQMFSAMNEARANMSMSAMLSDFKAVASTLEEMKKAGSEAGSGSMEDMLATAFITGLLNKFGAGGLSKSALSKKVKSGRGRVEEMDVEG